jgi:hypothetical protein
MCHHRKTTNAKTVYLERHTGYRQSDRRSLCRLRTRHRQQIARDVAATLQSQRSALQSNVQKAEQAAAGFLSEHGLGSASSSADTRKDQRINDHWNQLLAFYEQIGRFGRRRCHP